MHALADVKTVSVKMPKDFAEETEAFAKAIDQHLSQYIRDAVREKNERQMAERIKFLVSKFSAEAEAMNDEFDATVGDNLAFG